MRRNILPVENSKKEIVQQPNELSKANFSGSATAYKIILFGLFKVLKDKNLVEPKKRNVYTSFTKQEFLQKLGMGRPGKETDLLIERTCKDMGKCLVTFRTREKFSVIPWFSSVEFFPSGAINLKFNQEIIDLLNFEMGYSALELVEVGNLQSFYALRYYALAKSKSGYQNPWFEFTEKEIRQLFQLEKNSYPRRNTFVEKVIQRPIDEINEKTSLHIELEKEKLGVGNYKWRFICSNKVEPVKKIKKTDSRKAIEEKREINQEQEDLAWYKMNYAEEWQEIFDEEMSQPTLFSGLKRQTAEANTYLKLKEKYQFERNENNTRRNFEKEK